MKRVNHWLFVSIALNVTALVVAVKFNWQPAMLVGFFLYEAILIALMHVLKMVSVIVGKQGGTSFGRIISGYKKDWHAVVKSTSLTAIAFILFFVVMKILWQYEVIGGQPFLQPMENRLSARALILLFGFCHILHYFHEFIFKGRFFKITVRELKYASLPRIITLQLWIIFSSVILAMVEGSIEDRLVFTVLGALVAVKILINYLNHLRIRPELSRVMI